MIEDLPNVPPALIMLASELPKCATLKAMRDRIKGMLRDLRDQSEVFEIENVNRSVDSKSVGRFEVHLHGPMDLLSGAGCSEPACRFAAADRVARSVGLIADRVWLTDLLTEKFVDFGRPTNAKLDDVLVDVLVLARLMPLVRAGVVKFRSPWATTCQSCKSQFEHHVDVITRDLFQEFRSEFRIERTEERGYAAYMGNCTDPMMVFRSGPGVKRLPSVRRIAEQWVHREIRSTMWTAREAAMTGGAILSNSRVGLAGLIKMDGRAADMNSLLLLERERSLTVPWVSELDASQIVELRSEASRALPLLREKLCRALTVSDAALVSSTPSSGLIEDLREQAVEVRSELEEKRKSASRFWKGTYGILGLGLSAYGAIADQIIPGVGGLLPVIQLLINHKSGHESDVAKLTSKPGYVLVKAQDILSHADE